MTLSERIRSCVDDGYRVPVEWATVARLLEMEHGRYREALERIANGFEASDGKVEAEFMKHVARAALNPPF